MPPADLLTIDEFAAELGVHHVTIRRWIDGKGGNLAHVRVGGRVYVPRAELDRLLAVQPARTGT